MFKVLMGLSGGIDSTYGALRLREEGHHVEGVYMRLHGNDEYHALHQARAQKAADFLGIVLHVLDLRERFEREVITPFVHTYQEGLTPNPCALCNRQIKFGAMWEFAQTLGMEALATGHYVRHDGHFLYQAHDHTKDQSYFLFAIDPTIIPHLLFPLGSLTKEEVREKITAIEGLQSFASQGESNEICFVDRTYIEFLNTRIEVDHPGEVVDLDGNVIGEHKGYLHYTIGKRKGFSVRGAHDPHFVLDILPQSNRIVVGKRNSHMESHLYLDALSLFDTRSVFECTIKLRYRSDPLSCQVERIGPTCAKVTLQEPTFALASGQAGVLYEGEKLLGGGWIRRATM